MAMLRGSLRGRRNRPPAAATRVRFTSGMPNAGLRRGDDQVAGEHDLGAAGEGRAVDGGDDRLGALAGDDAAEAAPLGVAARRPGPALICLEVGAGAEDRAGRR